MDKGALSLLDAMCVLLRKTDKNELRQQIANLINECSQPNHPVYESLLRLLSSLENKHQNLASASDETGFNTYVKMVRDEEYVFGIEELSLLGYAMNQSIMVYQKHPNLPIGYHHNSASSGHVSIYFNSLNSFYPLLDPIKACLFEDSYFLASFDQKPFFLSYSLEILKSSLHDYANSLVNFENGVYKIRDWLGLSEEESQEFLDQESTDSLMDFLNDQKRKRIGVFYLNRQASAAEKKQVSDGLKIFLIRPERNAKFILGFANENHFQACTLNPKRHRTLLKDLNKNRNLSKSDETDNTFLDDYFRANDMICQLEEGKFVQCSNRKLKLFPAETGIFANLNSTRVKVKEVFDTIKGDFERFLTSKKRVLSDLHDLIDLSQICCTGTIELSEILTRIIINKNQLTFKQFLQEIKKTRDKLLELTKTANDLKSEFFMARLIVFFDQKSELEEKNADNHASVQHAIAAKYAAHDPNKSFRWCEQAVEQNYALAACWMAKMYETGFGVEKDLVQAIKYYELEISRGDWTGIARESIERLKTEINDPQVLRDVGSWYASNQLEEARFWLKAASSMSGGSDDGLNYSWGQVHETNKDFETAMNYYVAALKENNKIQALKSIENLDSSLGSEHPDLDLDDNDMIEIAEAFESNQDYKNSVVWFTRASKLGSARAMRKLKHMIGKNEFKEVQFMLGEFFENMNDFEKATKCYKKMSPVNVDSPDEEVKIPWEALTGTLDEKDNEEIEDHEIDRDVTNEDFGEEAYLPAEKLKPISVFYQNGMDYVLVNRRKEKYKVFNLSERQDDLYWLKLYLFYDVYILF